MRRPSAALMIGAMLATLPGPLGGAMALGNEPKPAEATKRYLVTIAVTGMS